MKLPKIETPGFSIVALAAVLVIIERILFPQLVFDSTSLILFAIAAICVLLPQLLKILPPLKKAKYGDFEIEFDEAIKRLEQRVVEAESTPTPLPTKFTSSYPPMRETYVQGYKDILASETTNTEKVLAAAILADQMLTETARGLELLTPELARNPRAIVHALSEHGIISLQERQAFDEFWNLRNRIVHVEAKPPTDEQTARVLDLLWRLVRNLA